MLYLYPPNQTMLYHAIPYHNTPCYAMPYHTIPCHDMTSHAIKHHVPYHTIPYLTLPYRKIPYHIILYLHTTPYAPSTLYYIFFTIPYSPHHTISYRIIAPFAYHSISILILPYHRIPKLIRPYQTLSYNTILHLLLPCVMLFVVLCMVSESHVLQMRTVCISSHSSLLSSSPHHLSLSLSRDGVSSCSLKTIHR